MGKVTLDSLVTNCEGEGSFVHSCWLCAGEGLVLALHRDREAGRG